MGGKHLKRLRAEKSKVHLKKKKLSKGENLTKTSFTVKKIFTVEQLKVVSKDEPVSNWNVPLKDLLIKLNHYNFTSRLNSISGIKELVMKNPEILKGPLLKPLISRLLERITDEEHKIRVTAVDVLSLLFDMIPTTSLTPFHNIINVYLGCGMTHRNPSIQQDSLKLLDVIIKYSSAAIKQNFKVITENFLRIVKSYLYEGHCRVFSSGKSKQDLEKNRRETLHRFYNFMVAGYSVTSEEQLHCKSINKNTLNKISLRNLMSHYKKIPDLYLLEKNVENKERLFSKLDLVEYKSLCSLTVPLLFETWIEFSPGQRFDENLSESVLTQNVGELLFIVLKILLFLYEKALMLEDHKLDQWFVTNYSAGFQKLFVSNFPYLPSTSPEKSTSSCCNDFRRGFHMFITQNLIICYLAFSFQLVPESSSVETKMERYISGALMMKNIGEIEILSKVVETAVCASKNKKTNCILKILLEAYDTSNLDFRRSISKIVTKIILQENEEIFNVDHCIMNWMKSLPDRLCESKISLQEVDTILKLIVKAEGHEVLREIENKAEDILKNLNNITVEGISQFEGQKMIADILYRCNQKILVEITNKILLNKIYPEDLRNYILDIFSQKLRGGFKKC